MNYFSRRPRWTALHACLLIAFNHIPTGSAHFLKDDEQLYMSKFNELISDSYSALESAPSALLAECRTSSTSSGQILPERIVTSSSSTVSSSLVSQQCGINDGYACVIPAGMTLRMESNLNVSALTVRGKVEWTDATQSSTHQWLCAGFIAVEEGGVFNLEVLSGDLSAWVYIKDNGAMHSVLRTRVFGAVGGNVSETSTLLNVRGRPLSRTWSLLASPVLPGDQSVFLMHDPVLMGWRLGDRITIAPTKPLSEGQGESFQITSIGPYNEIKLNGVVTEEHISEATLNSNSNQAAIQSAEVVNLTRNVVITGDDFRHIECSNDFSPSPGVDTSTQGCRCAGARTKCTMGLHTIHSMGGISSIQHTRIEKCGQRGVEGKYCLHFHLMQSCPECLFKGNAIEYGHQRGIIVHGTHLSTLEDNVINDVRGAGIYIEDGNEMYNNLNYNVIVCPWRLKDQRKYGCTVPGTDNHEADTAINQSGIFAISAVNNWRGNRAAGSFNGMFIDPNAFGGQGRGAATGKVCPRTELFGRFEGNTFHSHGRFGTYILNMNYPKNTGQNVENNGFVDIANCNAFTSTGEDNGVSVAFVDHVDYQNAFVGQYEAGDIGYVGHTSTDNSNLIYWKETKNFADGCSAHISQGYYRNGNMALPDQGTFIIEETIFDQGIHLEPNHHCNVGVTGVLCMPQYVLHKVTWNGGVGAAGFTPGAWVTFQNMNTQGHNNNQNHGGIFVLSPEDAIANRNRSPGPSNFFFPAGYSSLVSNKFGYLLAIDASTGVCALASTLNDAEPGVDGSTLGTRYGGGILCKPELRALKIYSRGLNAGSAPDMLIEVWNGDVNDQVGAPVASQFIPYHQIGGNGQTRKQGYSVPVVPGPTYSYRLSLRGGGDIPAEWIIEFSDPIMSNRFYSDADTLQLVVQGRNCGQSINSRHDRRYIWGGFEYLENYGHGACTNYSDMPSISCSNPSISPAIAVTECAGDCAGGCSVNEFCDCGSKSCHCKAGFIGENCDIDLCAAARCSSSGVCSATYLGGDIPVSRQACICEDGWSGPLCDINPCAGKNCSGHGTCKAAGDSDFTCECDAGFSGESCETTCGDYCSGGGGQYPFGCATNLPGVVKYFCNQSGGCAYSSDTSDPGPQGFCAYKTEASGVCECYSQNDCKIADKCDASGVCSEETNRPNGTPCNSVPYGKCLAGVCIAGGPSPPTPTLPSPSSPSPTVSPCECPSCTQQVLDSFAGDYTCRARIEWLQNPDGGELSENDACILVAHDEFPNECGACDPLDCSIGLLPPSSPPSIPLGSCPVLHWSDEFNGNELDTSKWNILLGDGCSYGICGWGNNELQIYQSENIVVRNGKLTIEARKEGATSGYTSARISTDQKADFDVFGRFEARIRVPIDQGIWPAFWMLPSDWIYGGWPKSGEIDIMENVGDPGLSHGTIHFGDSFHQYQGTSIGLPNGESFADNYHVFAVDREENLIRWIMDDVVYLEKTPADIGTNTWPFNERFHFLLNVAVGGTWPGNPDTTTTFPQSMDVDYVRVYNNPLPTFLGPRVVKEGESGVSFEIFNGYEDSEYYWDVPPGASIVSGQGTDSINVNFGVSGGHIQCTVSSSCGTKQFNVAVRVTSGICGCHTSCSQQVLDTSAGDYTCGERINWLQSPDGGNFSDIEACITIAHDEFPIECGACDPLKCNSKHIQLKCLRCD
mmetsp:Transcript_7462/g.10983  ORF Transcript_7462/g.10983 Transcript_7462/m.10983 type:complete len:1688 (-) Transcript_7462:558-5621(-)